MSYREIINDFLDWFDYYVYDCFVSYYDILDYIEYDLPWYVDSFFAYECLCYRFGYGY